MERAHGVPLVRVPACRWAQAPVLRALGAQARARRDRGLEVELRGRMVRLRSGLGVAVLRRTLRRALRDEGEHMVP